MAEFGGAIVTASTVELLRAPLFLAGDAPATGIVADDRVGTNVRWKRTRQWGRVGDPAANLLPWINLNPAGNPIQGSDTEVQRFEKPGTGWNMISLSWRWGFDGCVAYNVFPWEGKNPKGISNWIDKSTSAIIDHCNKLIAADIAKFDAAMAAWGGESVAQGYALALLREIKADLRAKSRSMEIWCIGKNSDGSPKHPARVSHSLRPMLFGTA